MERRFNQADFQMLESLLIKSANGDGVNMEETLLNFLEGILMKITLLLN